MNRGNQLAMVTQMMKLGLLSKLQGKSTQQKSGSNWPLGTERALYLLGHIVSKGCKGLNDSSDESWLLKAVVIQGAGAELMIQSVQKG
jgi:hypothetical protein